MVLVFENVREKLQFSPVDFFGVKYGLKPVSRIDASALNLLDLKALCKKEGIKLKVIKTEIYNSEKKFTMAYISKSEKLIKEAARAERKDERLKVGELFGYPECCVKFFIRNLERRKQNKQKGSLILDAYKNSTKPFSYYLNSVYNTSGKGNIEIIHSEIFFHRLGGFCLYYIPHHACSFNCKKSIAFGKEMEKILKEEMPEFNTLLKDVLKKPLLVFDDIFFCTFNGSMKNNKVEYETIIPDLSFLDTETEKIILKGNEIIKEKDGLYVYKNSEVVGRLGSGLLLQFE